MKKAMRNILIAFLVVILGIGIVPDYVMRIKVPTAVTTVLAANTTTITVNEVNTSVAEKLHTLLYSEKAVKLKVKGNKTSSLKLVKKLRTKVGKVNKLGVVFQYDVLKKSGSYYLYQISTEDAKLYMYAVKFTEMFQDNLLEYALKNRWNSKDDYEQIENEINSYSDMNEYKRRIMYDMLVFYYKIDWEADYDGDVTGYDNRATVVWVKGKLLTNFPVEYYYLVEKNVDKSNETAELCSYNEFCSRLTDSLMKEYLENYTEVEYKINGYYLAKEIKNGLNFGDLSQAMKVYVLSNSEYFAARDKSKGFGMVYSFKCNFTIPYKEMKLLYQNKARGVCQDYAWAEQLVLEQWDIPVYYGYVSDINHAYTIIKAKNSKGKTLWIPFDYGIGPSFYTEKSENERYKIYLSYVKEAPKYKNFVDSDFN